MVEQVLNNILLFLPETTLVVTLCILILAQLISKGNKPLPLVLALVGTAVAGFFAIDQYGIASDIFSGMITVDPFASFFKVLVAISTIFILLFSFSSTEVQGAVKRVGEYSALIVAATLGMFLMAGASNLLMIVLAIELTSLSSYVLAGYTKEAQDSSEASLKYVIYGGLSSGIMLYGISLLYGVTGATDLVGVRESLSVEAALNYPLLLVATIMIIVGFGYKISAVPFHFWTPDVYEGAPITVTAFLSVASKAAGFAIMIRFFVTTSYGQLGSDALAVLQDFEWPKLIAIISVLTMTLGNVVAIWQDNMKGVVVYSLTGLSAVLIYLVIYLFMNLGAFYVVMLVAGKTGSEDINSYKGLGYRAPVVSAAFVVFLISLTGLPPTAGFVGKLYLFSALLDANWIWLAVIGAVNSVISLYYYVRVMRNMYLRDSDTGAAAVSLTRPQTVLLFVLLIPTIFLGLYFAPLVDLANASVMLFGVQ
jgi:NADH-quinone oxidoreductase subunit N